MTALDELHARDLPLSVERLARMNGELRAAGLPEVDKWGRRMPGFEPPADAPVPSWAQETGVWEPDGDSWQRGHCRRFADFDLYSLQYAHGDGTTEAAGGSALLSFLQASIECGDPDELTETCRRISRDMGTVAGLLTGQVAPAPAEPTPGHHPWCDPAECTRWDDGQVTHLGYTLSLSLDSTNGGDWREYPLKGIPEVEVRATDAMGHAGVEVVLAPPGCHSTSGMVGMSCLTVAEAREFAALIQAAADTAEQTGAAETPASTALGSRALRRSAFRAAKQVDRAVTKDDALLASLETAYATGTDNELADAVMEIVLTAEVA